MPVGISLAITFNADGVTFGADGHQHLLSASCLSSALMLMASPLVLTAVSISHQHLTCNQHLPSAPCLSSASMLMVSPMMLTASPLVLTAISISCQHLACCQHLLSASQHRPSPLRPQGMCHGKHPDNAILTRFCAPSTLVDALCMFCVVLFIK